MLDTMPYTKCYASGKILNDDNYINSTKFSSLGCGLYAPKYKLDAECKTIR